MNWGSLKSQVLSRIHDSRLGAKVSDWFNEVQLEMLAAAQWRHLEDEITLPTTAPYSTGTATASAGASIVTFGGGASIPTGAAGQLLIAGGYYYKISSRDSSSQVTIDGTIVAALSSATYKIVFYQLSLPANFSTPRIYEVTLQGSGFAEQLRYTTEHDLFEMDADESRIQGRPYLYRFWAGAIQLWPPPDAAYNCKVFYHREPSEMITTSADSTVLDWPDDLQYALLQGVLSVGYEFIDDTLASACRERFETGLADAVRRNNRRPGIDGGRMKRWDGRSGGGRLPYRLPEPIG